MSTGNDDSNLGNASGSSSMNVRLLSSDNKAFIVRKESAEQSIFIKDFLEESETNAAIALPNVAANILQKVIEWCDHHSSDPTRTEEEARRATAIDAWDEDFFQNVDQETLFDIILAANYLDIKGLLDVGCRLVSNKIIGMSANEIQTVFNISTSFTPEEEAQIRRENEWHEDR